MRDRLLKPAIDHRRLGQFLTGDWVKNIPALTGYQFYIRCFPYLGDYQFNIYAYSKACQQLSLEQKDISLDDGISLK